MKDSITNGNCWVAYFDILGFKNKVLDFNKQNQGHLEVFVDRYFLDVIKAIKRSGKYNPDYVSITWFSDSFLLFSHNDTLTSFVAIEQAARHFFWRVICRGIPLRGALGYGEFYGDLSRSIFLGQALIDTYHYAEKQKWIGFTVTPSACNQLDGAKYLRSNYVKHDVLFKQNKTERLFAYKPDVYLRDRMLRNLQEMRDVTKHEHPDKYEGKYKPVYERTIVFLKTEAK
jgi:hypothetical protein